MVWPTSETQWLGCQPHCFSTHVSAKKGTFLHSAFTCLLMAKKPLASEVRYPCNLNSSVEIKEYFNMWTIWNVFASSWLDSWAYTVLIPLMLVALWIFDYVTVCNYWISVAKRSAVWLFISGLPFWIRLSCSVYSWTSLVYACCCDSCYPAPLQIFASSCTVPGSLGEFSNISCCSMQTDSWCAVQKTFADSFWHLRHVALSLSLWVNGWTTQHEAEHQACSSPVCSLGVRNRTNSMNSCLWSFSLWSFIKLCMEYINA